MPITPTNPFKGRQFPGEVIILCVRWYLRYPLAYEHVAELLAERGVEVDPSCILRWVQAYAPELDRRCRPHLKPTKKCYRVDESYIKVKGQDSPGNPVPRVINVDKNAVFPPAGGSAEDGGILATTRPSTSV